MPLSLSEHIKNLKQDIAGISRNPILEMFKEEKCKMIDELSKTNHYINSQLKEIQRHLKKSSIEHTVQLEHAFGLYNEIVVFDQLKQKCSIDPVKRVAKIKTPDFVIKTEYNTSINLELKTMFPANSKELIKEVQNNFSDLYTKRKAVKNGTLPAGTDLSVSWNFFKKFNNQEVQRIDMIELLYAKIGKPKALDQLNYQNNPGILLIDFAAFDYIFCPQESLPFFIYPSYHAALVSGLFWHLCFGRKGERLMEMPENMDIGRPCFTSAMQRDGLLYEFPDIKAMIISIKYGNERRLLGLHSVKMEDESVLHIMHSICDFVNNDLNSEYYLIGYDPRIKYWPDDADYSSIV